VRAAAMMVVDLTNVLTATKGTLEANEKDRFLVEREVDHLSWVKGLSLELMGAGELTGALDPAKCRLGKWI
jgi:hypothetical protein